MGLGFDDDLVLGIDGGHTGIALDDAFAGGHLGAVVVGAVALADSCPWCLCGPRGLAVSQSRSWAASCCRRSAFAGCFLGEVGFDGQRVVLPVAFEHLLRGRFEFVGLVREVGPRAALGFGGIARQLDAVDGEHLAADQSLPVAEVEHLSEELGDFVTEARDKGGKGGEVRGAVAGQGNEGDVFAAGRSMPRLLTMPWL